MVIPADQTKGALKVLDKLAVVDYDYSHYSADKTRFNIIIRKERTRETLNLLNENFSHFPEFKLILKNIEAYLPYPGEDSEEFDSYKLKNQIIAIEEIYSNIREMIDLNVIFLLMTVLSSVIAAVGVINNNVAVIIAAMIIAPLLGPGIGLSFGLAVGDKKLAITALKTSLVGIFIGFAISVVLGVLMKVNPEIPSIITRTNVGQGGFVLALASGFAGALAVTAQLPSALIGVMIAISLMPPLVTCGLLIGNGDYFLAGGALLIFLVNLVSIYFSALLTFYKEDIKPLDAKNNEAAKKMAKRWIILFFIILMGLFVVDIYQTQLWNLYVQPIDYLQGII